nr:hypothetical protein CFP56_12006 [Quercus suber]
MTGNEGQSPRGRSTLKGQNPGSEQIVKSSMAAQPCHDDCSGRIDSRHDGTCTCIYDDGAASRRVGHVVTPKGSRPCAQTFDQPRWCPGASLFEADEEGAR